MCGLSYGSSDVGFTDIDYAIYLMDGGELRIYEAGNWRQDFSGTYMPGDHFQVRVVNGVVQYVKNGAVFLASGIAPTYPLLVDTALMSVGATLSNVMLTGTLGSSAPAQGVVWTNLVNTAANGATLTKTNGSEEWVAGGVSTKGIAQGDGYVEFTLSDLTGYRMAGLGHGDSSQYLSDIEHAVYAQPNGTLHIFESGAYVAQVGTYVAGDRIRVAVESGVVKYRKGGTLLYTSLAPVQYPLLLDTSLATTGSSIENAVIAGALVDN